MKALVVGAGAVGQVFGYHLAKGGADVTFLVKPTIVVLQPGLDDHAFVAEHAGEARIVDGTINFLSYHAPLPGETRFAAWGMAYWFFPGKGPFSGERADSVIAALEAGGMPAKRVKDLPSQNAFPSALHGLRAKRCASSRTSAEFAHLLALASPPARWHFVR